MNAFQSIATFSPSSEATSTGTSSVSGIGCDCRKLICSAFAGTRLRTPGIWYVSWPGRLTSRMNS